MTPGENVLADIPIHQDAAVEFGDLSVERNLRSLRDDPAGRAESFGDLVAEQLAEPERAGEYDRCQHRRAAVAAQVAKHRQPRVIRVCGCRPHGVLHSDSPRRRIASPGQIDVEQQRRGEVTDEAVHIGMEGLAAEQRQVEQETRGARPARQSVGEAGGEHHCGRDAAGSGMENSASRVPGSNQCQRRVLLRDRVFQARVRQLWRVRQFGNALRPPVPVGSHSRLRPASRRAISCRYSR